MHFSPLNQVAYPLLNDLADLACRPFAFMGNVCRNTNTFLFGTILLSEIAELTFPHIASEACRALNIANTPIENLFMHEEISDMGNIPQYWEKDEVTQQYKYKKEERYVNTICAMCDGLSNLKGVVDLAEYLGLLDLKQVASQLGNIPLFGQCFLHIGLSSFCTTAGLIGKIFSITSVCLDVKSQATPIRPDQKAAILFSSVVLVTKIAVIAGTCFGWAPSATTLAVFSIARTTCLFTRCYLRNTHLNRND